MSLAYVPPRVTVTESVSPSFNPTLLDPNQICIIGPTQGYQNYVEILSLVDDHPVTLGATFPDLSTLSVVDSQNIASTPFQASTATAELDYDIDSALLATTGRVSIARAMQTTIPDGQSVVAYYQNSASPSQGTAHTDSLVLNGTTAAPLPSATTNTQAGSIVIMTPGAAPAADISVVGEGTPTPTIVWVNTATVIRKFQTVYIDYDIAAVHHSDLAVQLDNLVAVSLPANAANIVVKTAAGANTAADSAVYALGATVDLDYLVTGSGATTAIVRSPGTTTMGLANDRVVVRVTYRATPPSFYQPTRCFSQGDVEAKFGPAWDASGAILNPVSVAAALAFANGINAVIIQALFHAGTPRTQPTGVLTDWQDTLESLRDVEDLNVIVPLISTGGLTATDGGNIAILEAVQAHCFYMQANAQQFLQALCGEDSTNGALASMTALRTHAQTLRAGNPAASMALVSPGAYTYTNPVTGNPATLGGQYIAACLAGMYGRYSVQTPLTRKRLSVITGVQDGRTESEKNNDAQSGLLVIESKRGTIQIRHAISVANTALSDQELNVVRAKYWMITTLISTLDTQVIGNYIVNDDTSFAVQLHVDSVLQQLLVDGSIVDYTSVQVRRNPSLATGYQVQFSYLPAYAVNYLDVVFSIDNTTGVTLSTAALPTQGQGLI